MTMTETLDKRLGEKSKCKEHKKAVENLVNQGKIDDASLILYEITSVCSAYTMGRCKLLTHYAKAIYYHGKKTNKLPVTK